MKSYRPAGPADKPRIEEACRTYLARIKKRSKKAWVQGINIDKVLADLFSSWGDVWIVDDTFLVWFETGVPWHSDALWLNEKLMLALSPGGDFQSVIDFLEDAADAHGAERIVVGTALALSDRALAKIFEKAGFSQAIITLTK